VTAQTPIDPCIRIGHVHLKVADLERALKRLQAETTAELDALLPANLARAFRGQLVPQDPNDEPASVLFECFKRCKSSRPPC